MGGGDSAPGGLGSGVSTRRCGRSLGLLTRRPVVNAALLGQELGIESTNAHRYLNPLTEARILVETSSGPRNRVWRSPEVLVALDAFAERAARRD